MTAGRSRVCCSLALAAMVMTACATPVRTGVQADPISGPWTGRLALQVQDDQSQSFSAGFELRGQAPAGELTLFTPLGGTAAALSWQPGSATLKADGKTRQFESVDAMLTATTGSALPLAALFDWLRGTNTPAPGWTADLSQLEQGRLRAQRLEPPPVADLRLVLDR